MIIQQSCLIWKKYIPGTQYGRVTTSLVSSLYFSPLVWKLQSVSASFTGKHWQRFVVYSLWSWMAPAIIIGAALGAEFSGDEILQYVRPGYGANACWINRASGLLIFTVAPVVVVMVLNAAFFSWSAYLICTTTSMLQNMSRTHKDFRLYVRLALIMGLTWVTGLIAGFADVLGMFWFTLMQPTLHWAQSGTIWSVQVI